MEIKKAKCSKRFRGKGRFSNRNVRFVMREVVRMEPEPLEEIDFLNSNLSRGRKRFTRQDTIESLNLQLYSAKNEKACCKPLDRKAMKEFYKTQDCGGEPDYNF